MSIRSFVFGVLLGVSAKATFGAFAAEESPRIVGGSGILKGVEIVDREGDRICDDPEYLSASKIISCE